MLMIQIISSLPIKKICKKFSQSTKMCTLIKHRLTILTLQLYLSGNDLPHLLHFKGLSEVCNFCTWIRKSVFLPQVVGQRSHWKIGLSPTEKTKISRYNFHVYKNVHSYTCKRKFKNGSNINEKTLRYLVKVGENGVTNSFQLQM